ncbi:hypothetical protein [Nonomuraea wenchangensis]|uniref:hypothetical protein n=1 Tax=Nonomuraea wenchangensis TaxID=568860 RepID=UPI003332E161
MSTAKGGAVNIAVAISAAPARCGWWASGFLLKDVDPPDLVHACLTVVRDEALLAPAITRRLIERFLATPPPGRPAGDLRHDRPDAYHPHTRQARPA